MLTQNSKLKKTGKELGVRIFNFGIPAYKTASGKLTCPMADTCVKFCYAKKGAYIWSNVKPAFERRYELTKQDDFVQLMTDEVKRKRADYIRIHDSGDFYSRKYLAKWLQIARDNPSVRFYAYTNMVELIKESELPENFDVIFSDSGKQKHLIDPSRDRHTKIFKTHIDLKNWGYKDASDVDLYATKWFNDTNKVGLVFH